MEAFKNTILGPLPESWKIEKLGEIAEFSQGIQIGVEKHKHSPEPDHHRFIRIVDYTQPGKEAPRYVPSVGERYYVNKDDLVMIRYGTPGVVGRGIEGIIANNLFKITFNHLVINNYASHYFQYPGTFNRLLEGSASSTMPAINFGFLRTLRFVLPPLPEQQTIAEILNTVDEKIEVITHQILEAEELKKGLMQHLLTKGIGHSKFKDSPMGKIPAHWDVVKQSEVATFYNGRAYKLSEWETHGTPVIRLQNLTGSGKEFYYSNMDLPDHQYCHSEDLLYMWSATFGPVFWKGPKAIYHYHIWKIEPSDRLDKFFHFYLLDDVTRRMKNESHGSTMLHITKGGMEKLKIQLPPLEEQHKIAAKIGSADEKVQILKDKKSVYSELKKGLMQNLLTGKIRANIPIEA